jgi:hypothetical protein
MTHKEAKELALELWRYLAAHPEIYWKSAVPRELVRKIMNLPNMCPLCAVFRECNMGCPLFLAGEGCFEAMPVYRIWCAAGDNDLQERKQAAEKIVRILEAWEETP